MALLLWRRTRLVAWVAVVAFHVATWLLFPIGVFPWLMIGVTTIFFEPDWPERIATKVRVWRRRSDPVDDRRDRPRTAESGRDLAPVGRRVLGAGDRRDPAPRTG